MQKYIKGLIIISIIALMATVITKFISPYLHIERLSIGILLGILYSVFRNLEDSYKPGIQLALKNFLKWGIVLLGFKLNFRSIVELGPTIMMIIIGLIPMAIIGSQKLGSLIGVNKKVATLIGVGSSICGASAIVAMTPVISAEDDDSILAVSIISFLGAIGVIVYTALAQLLDLNAITYGIWSGLSLQGVAHAIAAAFAKGNEAGEIGTLVKMARVMMLAPVSILLSLQFAESSENKKASIPRYVLFFIAAGILGSIGIVPTPLIKTFGFFSNLLILSAMIAMGLIVDLKHIQKTGLKIVVHGLLVFFTISISTFMIVKLII